MRGSRDPIGRLGVGVTWAGTVGTGCLPTVCSALSRLVPGRKRVYLQPAEPLARQHPHRMRSSPMRHLTCLALLALAGCSGSLLGGNDGATQTIAVADVSGRVFLASGALANSGIVTIKCALIDVIEVPVGTEGQY